ncbi:PA14 domain-containing protein [Streptomyces showdoensis]|uniref:PA14 domain-containing protein n=1 Tax=Streptomyces showdoensis TaxID=68268 RepID=UPI001F0B4010|nr:PA14 domain-containing protein [Streptomyces showdoensis]
MRTARHTTVATAVVIAAAGGLLTTTATPASAAVTCASPAYKREFFANTTLTGTPRRTDCDSAVNESWTGAPAPGLPKDRFGVRWTVTRDFGSGGPFTLPFESRDGIRIHLDGVRTYNIWGDYGTVQKRTLNLTIPKGRHTLRVDFVNWTGPANVKFSYAPRTAATVDKVRPLTPAGATVAYDKATGRAKVAWARNQEMDLAGYRVYRRLDTQPAFPARPLAATTALSFTDTPPTTGGRFLYEVRAYDRANNESPGTADLAVTTADRTAPAVPTAVTAAVAANSVLVGWQPVADAAGYQVLRAATEDGPYTPVSAWLSTTEYRDTGADPGKQWYYRVVARDAAGNASAPSAPGTTGAPDTTAPEPVTGLAGEGTTAGNRLTWTASASPDTLGYEILGAPAGQEDPDGPEFVTGTSFHDAFATIGAQYAYRVAAVDAAGNRSPVEAVLAVRPLAAEVVTPTVSGSQPFDMYNRVSFTVPEGTTDVSGYRLYRRTATKEAWTAVDLVNSGRTTTDRTAPVGRSFYYVVAVDREGREGAPSAETSVERVTPVLATPLSPPRLTVVQDVRVAVKVDVRPAEADLGKGISGYTWRASCAPGGGWKTVTATGDQPARIDFYAPSAGPCTLEVYALGHYGTGSSVTSASHDFFWER